MPDKPDFYDVEELRLFLIDPYIEVRTSGIELAPSPIHRGFLLALCRKYPGVVTYQELWQDVWRSKYEITNDDRAKIQTTKGQLTAWLKTKNVKSLSIESKPGEGYRLTNVVVAGWFDDDKEEEQSIEEASGAVNENAKIKAKTDSLPEQTLAENPLADSEIKSWKNLFFANARFLIPAAIIYGSLFQITAIMEIAYRFDIYGERAIIGGSALMLLNFAAVTAAGGLISYRLFSGKNGLLPAVGVIFTALLISIVISSQFLPIEPVTEARIQTQPALIAFGKNALLYFFPLAAVFIILPFYTVSAKYLVELAVIKALPTDLIVIEPKWLLIGCLGLMIVSFVSTNYLLDRLISENPYYHSYVGLIFLRMFIYFGLALGSLAWYYAKTPKS